MIASFLKSSGCFPDIAYCIANFLHYFGHIFNNEEMGIFEEGIKLFDWKKLEPPIVEGLLPPDLYVSDPFRVGINSAKSVTDFQAIKFCFCKAYNRLLELEQNFIENENSIKSIIEHIFQ